MRYHLTRKQLSKIAICGIAALAIVAIMICNAAAISDLLLGVRVPLGDNSGVSTDSGNNPRYNGDINQLGVPDINGNKDYFTTSGTAFSDTNRSMPVSMVDSGRYHILLIDGDGFVFAKGSNEHGQLGLGSIDGIGTDYAANVSYYYMYFQPVVGLNGMRATGVSAGMYHSVAIGYVGADTAANYKVYTWGLRSSGRLGDWGLTGDAESTIVREPRDITSNFPFAAGEYPVEARAGDYHTLIRTNQGRVFSFGCNDDGQLGNNSTTTSGTPQLVTGGLNFTAIDAGSVHSLGLVGSQIYTWGGNQALQLGNDTNRATIKTNPGAVFGTGYASISAGELHNGAITTAGALHLWGDNRGAKLGTGGQGDAGSDGQVPTTNINSPARASATIVTPSSGSSINTFKAVACGGGGTMAVDTNGNLVVSGYGTEYFGISNYAGTNMALTGFTGVTGISNGGLGVIMAGANMYHIGHASRYSENWYAQNPIIIQGAVYQGLWAGADTKVYDTRPPSSEALSITNASSEAYRCMFVDVGMIGLPTDYNRSTTSPSTLNIKDGAVIKASRLKLNIFATGNAAYINEFKIARLTKAQYDASDYSGTFHAVGNRGLIINTEGYYAVQFRNGSAVQTRKFMLVNDKGPDVSYDRGVFNATQGAEALVQLFDAFGLSRVDISGTASVFNPETGSYDGVAYSYGEEISGSLNNYTFRVPRNGVFTVTAKDIDGKTTTVSGVDINTAVEIINTAETFTYTASGHTVAAILSCPATGILDSTQITQLSGAGYTVPAVTYSSGEAPVTVETYTATATLQKSGGVTIVSSDFAIIIEKANVTFLESPQAGILFGQNLDEVSVSVNTAKNAAATAVGVLGEFSWVNEDIYPQYNATGVNTRNYSATFEPADKDNYNLYSAEINVSVTVTSGVSTSVITLGTVPQGSAGNVFEIDWASTPTEDLTTGARVAFNAVSDIAAGFLFGGVRGGGQEKYLSASKSYVMTFSADSLELASVASVVIKGVFTRYNDDGDYLVNNTIRRAYNGSNIFLDNSRLSLEDVAETTYSLYISQIVQTQGDGTPFPPGVGPTGIGVSKCTFKVSNSALGNAETDIGEINIEIIRAQLDVSVNYDESQGYDQATGWASALAYDIMPTNQISLPGALEKYYYSIDDGQTWIEMGAPNGGGNSPAYRAFIAAPKADIDLKLSFVREYRFIAVHETHGSTDGYGDLAVVAETVVPTTCKIDNADPELSVSLNGYVSGVWTNDDVLVTFSGVFGYSGATVYYSTAGGAVGSWQPVGEFVDTVDLATKVEGTLEWLLDYDQSQTYVFRIDTGTARTYYEPGSYTVKIDTVAPEITFVSKTNEGDDDWQKDVVTVVMTATDENGAANSGVVSAVLINPQSGAAILTRIGDDLTLEIPDYAEYGIALYDEAGNVSYIIYGYNEDADTIQEKVDTTNPAVTLNAYNFSKDVWFNYDAQFDFTINAGASGIRVLYTTDDETYLPLGDGAFLKEDGAEAAIAQIIGFIGTIDEDVNAYYKFKVESAAGRESAVIDFGTVKRDTVAPEFKAYNSGDGWSTDISPLQGDTWTFESFDYKFIVGDGGLNASLQSDIYTVEAYSSANLITDGNVFYNDGLYRYGIILDRCTLYTVIITDNAGNVTTHTFKVKIDNPDMSVVGFDYEAFIGETSSVYGFDASTWISREQYGDNAFLRLMFEVTYTVSGARFEYSTGDGVWLLLAEIPWDEDNLNDPDDLVQTVYDLRLDISNEQNNILYIRLVSGSGKINPAVETDPNGVELGYVRIDFTAPDAEIAFIDGEVNSLEKDYIENNWMYGNVYALFMTADATSGVANVEIRKYAYDSQDDNDGYENVLFLLDDGIYLFEMDGYAKYVVFVTDNAGNVNRQEIIPKIDNTDGFELNVSVTGYSENWITDENTDVQFDFTVDFTSSAYSAFGYSGASLLFSTDGGNHWVDTLLIPNGGVQSIDFDLQALTGAMTAHYSQNLTYMFKVVTGSGYENILADSYTVKKDFETPTITAEAVYASSGTAYDGSWTAANIRFDISFTTGVSGASYYYAVSASASDPSPNWILLGAGLSEGAHTGNITADETMNVYYYFRVVNGAGVPLATSAVQIRIDKVSVTADISAVYGDGDGEAYVPGTWTPRDVLIKAVNISAVPQSGLTISYQRSADGQTGWSNWTAIEKDYYGTDTGYILLLDTDGRWSYRLEVRTGAGLIMTTGIIEVRIDKTKPTLDINTSGTLLAGGENDGWYVSDVEFTFIHDGGISGRVLQYKVSADGINWSSEWTTLTGGDILTVTDPSEYGGTVRYYVMRALSGSGIPSDEYGYGELKVDTTYYTVTVNRYVHTKKGAYADVTGVGSTYLRGTTISPDISAEDTYFLKNVLLDGVELAAYTKGDLEKDYGFDFEQGGEYAVIDIYFYKEINLIYSDMRQYLQYGVNDVTITVDETDFEENFFPLEYSYAYRDSLNAPIAGKPTVIGVYSVLAELTGAAADSFIVNQPVNDELRKVTVVYFYGTGDHASPYEVNNYQDLTFIDLYMDTRFEYDYLGRRGQGTVFYQSCDIEIPSNYLPIGRDIDFSGQYYGRNFKIYNTGTIQVTDNFGIFLKIAALAQIEDVGVELNLNVTGNDIIVGFLAAEAESSVIIGCYSYGTMTINGGTVTAGGLVGKAVSMNMDTLFADVRIYARSVDGIIGGMIGEFIGTGSRNFHTTFTLSQITVVDGADSLLAGTVIGKLDGSAGGADGTLNAYLGKNLNINGIPYAEMPYGNMGSWGGSTAETRDISFFLQEETLIGNDLYGNTEVRTVRYLSKMRFLASGVVGTGTEADPFRIATEADFMFMELYPWAYFLQTNNIVISGVRAALNAEIAFTGEYDGGGYSIINLTVEGEEYAAFIARLSGTVKNLNLTDIDYTVDGTGYPSVYAGGLAAVTLEGASVSDVIVTGKISVTTDGAAYAGGVAGLIRSSTFAMTVAMVNIEVIGAGSLYAGGFAGQIENTTNEKTVIENVTTLSSVTAAFEKFGNVGLFAGSVYDGNTALTDVYAVNGTAYALGKEVAELIGISRTGDMTRVASEDYEQLITTGMVGAKTLSSLISGLYPFESGKGTYQDPFIIKTYQQLLLIGDFMYANFRLGNDIFIGDINNDGEVNEADGAERFGFTGIGKGAAFRGSLDGGSETNYSINNLTDSLFETNEGRIRNVTLNVYYKRYYAGHSALLTDRNARAITEGEDVVFGAVAKYTGETSHIASVIVTGYIYIIQKGAARVTAGGMVGIANGGTVMSSISYIDFIVQAYTADIGGAIGCIAATTKIDDSSLKNAVIEANVTLGSIYAYGVAVHAGLIAGIIRVDSVIENVKQSNAYVYVNDVEVEPENAFIGKQL